MQQGSDGDDLRIVLNVLKLSDSYRKEPRADNMVEQVGFTFLPGIFDGPVNERCIGTEIPASIRLAILVIFIAFLFRSEQRVRGHWRQQGRLANYSKLSS
jgi:hypothetical protein